MSVINRRVIKRLCTATYRTMPNWCIWESVVPIVAVLNEKAPFWTSLTKLCSIQNGAF